MKKYILTAVCLIFMSGCLPNAMEKPLVEMAQALENRNAAQFLAQIDMPLFAEAEMENTKNANPALQTLDNMGKMLGLNNIQNFFGSSRHIEQSATERFTRGVSTGELILFCQKATTPNCPWVAQSLLDAKVKKLSDTSAVAMVTTPAGITSWLALAKIHDSWKIVGKAPLESEAAYHAEAAINKDIAKPSSPAQPTPQIQPDAPAPPPPAKKAQEGVVRL